MKLKYHFLFIILTSYFLMDVNEINAKTTEKIISTIKEDITGDKQQEIIQIKRNVNNKYVVEVNFSEKNVKPYRMIYKSEQQPKVLFINYNEDCVKDMFVTTFTGTNREYYLYSYDKNLKFKNIALPESLTITAQFENNYKASISINETGKKYNVNFRNMKHVFEAKGLYQKGQLNEPTELIIHPFESLEPIKVNKGQFLLKGRQEVGEDFGEEPLLLIESIWKWDKNKWILKDEKVKKI